MDDKKVRKLKTDLDVARLGQIGAIDNVGDATGGQSAVAPLGLSNGVLAVDSEPGAARLTEADVNDAAVGLRAGLQKRGGVVAAAVGSEAELGAVERGDLIARTVLIADISVYALAKTKSLEPLRVLV